MEKIKTIIIFDRVLNKDLDKGVRDVAQLEIYESHIKSLKKIYDLGIRFFIASNQANVGRCLISIKKLDYINSFIKKTFEENGMTIEGFFCCTHAPEENCHCRKPKTGLIDKVKDLYPDYDFIFVGDSISDYETAINSKIQFALVGTGKVSNPKNF